MTTDVQATETYILNLWETKERLATENLKLRIENATMMGRILELEKKGT